MNEMKENIITGLYSGENEKLFDAIEHYMKEYPADTDVTAIKAFLEIQNNNFENAITTLESVYKRVPFDVDVYYLLGTAYLGKDALKAIWYLTYSKILATYFGQEYMFYNEQQNETNLSLAETMLEKIFDEMEQSGKINNLLTLKERLDYVQFYLDKGLCLHNDIIRSQLDVIGQYFYTDINDKRIVGFYNPLEYIRFREYKNISLQVCTGEMIKEIYRGKGYTANFKDEILLPIMTTEKNSVLCFDGDRRTYCRQTSPYHFNYYRLKGNTTIYANNEMIVGKPVPLKIDNKKKKLVISLFVDGLSQRVLEEEGLENVMPYTYKFFSKGMICNNMYTTSDWTYPSIASVISGLEVAEHMMVHPDINIKVPENKILFEYLQQAGYYTAMISGNWRISSTYGYDRGIDRYIAGHQSFVMHAEQVIANAIEHISAFDETNQYLWMSIGDLHDVADGFDMKTAIQTKTELKDREMEEKTLTSVKQFYSPQKRKAYIKTARQVDLHLKSLYDYIEENYKDEEFVVTIFGDHGQTYLNKPEEHHLAKGHANVGFMVRGGGCQGVSDEYMSLVSYPDILCKLADVDEKLVGMQGSLPVTFGGDEKAEFVLAETIHPGDKYMAAIYSDDYEFYFTTDNTMEKYFKIEKGDFVAKLCNHSGEEVKNEEVVKKYVDYLNNHIKYILSY